MPRNDAWEKGFELWDCYGGFRERASSLARNGWLKEVWLGTQGGILVAKYKCLVCGWIYDPAVGDPDGGIKPGTPFESIPDSWVCPVCGADKTQFEKL